MAFFFALSLFVQSLSAQVRGTIVGPGAERYPIAVSLLRNLGPGEDRGGLSEGIADAIARDLTLSGWFRVLDRSAYVEDPQRTGITLGTFDLRDWSIIGAEALIKGGFTLQGEDLQVELRLFDVYQAKEVVGKRYTGKTKDFRRIAHKFADEIIFQFTGVRGVFDTRIAYVSNAGGRFKEIYVAHLDGSDKIQVTNNRTINLFPSWSRDGRFAAVSLEKDGNTDIYLLDRTGKTVRRVTDGASIAVSPTWSPDGNQLAFVSNRSGSPQIYVLELASGKTRRLTFSGGYNTSPDWSPRGDRIAYTGRAAGRFNIFAIDAKGGDPQLLTSNGGDNEDASWSPDGRFILFTSNRRGRYQLHIMQANGENQQRLTASGGDDTSPSWSPRTE